jgi:hypothetical protein
MIAALILAHHSPGMLSRLVRRLEQYGVQCFIHIDAGVECAPFQAACSGTQAVFVNPRVEVRWGGYSVVMATLTLIRAALPGSQFSHFVLASGDSYPIKPAEQFRQLVTRPFEQIELAVIPPQKPMYQRISRTFLPDSSIGALIHREGNPTFQRFLTHDTVADFERIGRVFEMKKGQFPWRYAKGGQWWILTRPTMENCLEVITREAELIEWFTYSSVPDEALFQTILANFGPFKVGAGTPMYTVWERTPRPYLFSDPADLDLLKSAPTPLARKFSPKQGSMLLDMLDAWMDAP